MKIVELSVREFESLEKDHENKLLFDGKTFVQDFAFSQRVYPRIVNELGEKGDDTTACLIVDRNGDYVLWHEVEAPSSGTAPGHNLDRASNPPDSASTASVLIPSDQPRLSEASLMDRSPDELTISIATLVEQVVEEVLARKQQITLEQTLEQLVDVLQATIPAPTVATPLAHQLFTQMEQPETIPPDSQSVDAGSLPAPKAPAQQPTLKKYRGVSYGSQSVETKDAIPPEGAAPEQTASRKYRGVSY